MTIKEQHVREFSGFSFCLKYSRLVAKEAVTQKHQTAQTPATPQNKPQQNSALSSRRTRKETRKKTFRQ